MEETPQHPDTALHAMQCKMRNPVHNGGDISLGDIMRFCLTAHTSSDGSTQDSLSTYPQRSVRVGSNIVAVGMWVCG